MATTIPYSLVRVLVRSRLGLRAHYTMDVFTGAITALWVWTASSVLAPRVDAWLTGLL